jgi:hypothetical protein
MRPRSVQFDVHVEIDGHERTLRCGADVDYFISGSPFVELWTDRATTECLRWMTQAALIERAYEALAQQREADEARDEDARHHY